MLGFSFAPRGLDSQTRVKNTPPSWFQVTQHSMPSSTHRQLPENTRVHASNFVRCEKGCGESFTHSIAPYSVSTPVRNPYDILDSSQLSFLIRGQILWSSGLTCSPRRRCLPCCPSAVSCSRCTRDSTVQVLKNVHPRVWAFDKSDMTSRDR